MPQIATTHSLKDASDFPELADVYTVQMSDAKIARQAPLVDNEVRHEDNVMILVRECYIRDNLKDSFFGGDKPARIVISFEIKTDGKTISTTLGTFDKVWDGSSLEITDYVILPLTPAKGYLTLTVNLFRESELKAAKDAVSQTVAFTGHAVENIPVVGKAGSTLVGLTGELINLIATLAPDRPIIRETSTYIVDKKKFPDLKGVNYLKAGILEITEAGFEKKGEYDRPSRILLQIVKPA
jgi:hypothetical protein